ncbi:exodeoxyribonuclease III [Rhodobacteraceae bacterium NNCM2]|nr:exodeoxyribonuclease III [Coraliihabitans acroporae]
MALTIATWNINSVRLRIDLVTRFLQQVGPDVLCLQETKSPVEKIPAEMLAAAGYPHMIARGQKGYNGVAIVSRIPIEDAGHIDWCAKGDARHVTARLPGGALLHNFYVPAGGDEPDREKNPKFGHKLDFLAEMTDWCAREQHPGILVGDLNIAPLEEDVWSHKQLLKVVSHTPVEVEALNTVMATGGWQDVTRTDIPAPEKLYSWWSYRSKDWAAADKGRRLDHIWARGVEALPGSSRVLKEYRGEEKPSDHCPVLADFNIG